MEHGNHRAAPFSPARNAFARLTAGATFVLVFAGGLVTSTGSALAVPDWPLSFGQLFPPMVGGIFYEHGHRMIAGVVALMTLAQAIWTRRAEPRRWVRRLAGAALATVVVQALLGGITVLLLLPTPISVAHACLGQVFFCLTLSLAVVTGRSWLSIERRPAPAGPSLALLAACATGVVFLQLVLGAWMRHTGAGLAIPDFPLAFGRLVPDLDSTAVLIHFLHRVGAVVVTGFVVALALVFRRGCTGDALVVRPALGLVALVAIQIALGAFTIWTVRAPLPATAHVATGAAILGVSVLLTLRARARFEPAPRVVSHGAPARSAA